MPARIRSKITQPLFTPLLVATLLAAATSHAQGVSVNQASAAQQKSADKKLAEGQALFRAGKLDKAAVAFEEAHRIVENPEAELMLARTHQNLGDLVKAHAEYAASIAEAEAALPKHEKYRKTLQAARKELQELDGVLARLTVNLRHAPAGTTVVIDGEPVPAEKLGQPLLLPPGSIQIVATAPDGSEKSRRLTLSAGQDEKVDLAFVRDVVAGSPPSVEERVSSEPEPEAKPSDKPAAGGGKQTAAFIAGGVGVAGLAMFGVFGAMSNSKYNELNEACAGGRCPPNRQSDIDAGKRDQTLANVGLAVGLVGVGTSAALFLFAGSSSQQKEQQGARLSLGFGFGSINLRGRFE